MQFISKKDGLFVKWIFATMIILLFLISSAYANPSDRKISDLMKSLSFENKAIAEQTLNNGLIVSFQKPISGKHWGFIGDEYYYSINHGLLASQTYTLTADGVNLGFKNTSQQVIIIKWAESSITIGTYSGIPFLDGMKYKDAGNPSATPDMIIAPGQSIYKSVYLPQVSQENWDNSWQVDGAPVYKSLPMNITLVLKIIDNTGKMNYFPLQSPTLNIESAK